MIADDVTTAVTEPTDYVCNNRETPDGKMNIRLCLDPYDHNKNIRRKYYNTRTIDELLYGSHTERSFSLLSTPRKAIGTYDQITSEAC